LLRGTAILRSVALLLAVSVIASEEHSLSQPVAAWTLLAGAALVTAVTLWLSIVNPDALLSTSLVAVELALAAGLLLADGLVFHSGHVGSSQGGLAGSWPVAVLLTVGIAFGPWAGLAGGVSLGLAHLLSAPLNGVSLGALGSSRLLGFVSSFVLYAIYGVAAGYAVRIVRTYDDTISRTRARDEMAQVLHDGVLQTLAIIQRRSDDLELVQLARDQDRELRRFFLAAPDQTRTSRGSRRTPRVTRGELESQLRAAGERHLDAATRLEVLVAHDTPAMTARRGDALIGACGEALANVAKHAGASRVTVFVEPVGRSAVFCSVKDDGAGFDTSVPSAGMGIASSITGRLHDAGGRVEITSVPGQGSEVRMWV
jgi:signal transduction histidine kinase